MNKTLFAAVFISTVITACKGDTFVRSSDYPVLEKRIEKLSELFLLRSPVLDAEYEIYDVNMNTRSIPGPTDRDYKIILKVDEEHLAIWHEPELVTSFPVGYQWARDLLKGKPGYELSGATMQYASNEKEMIIFKDTGVIIIRIAQH